jgi:hypothetical protein
VTYNVAGMAPYIIASPTVKQNYRDLERFKEIWIDLNIIGYIWIESNSSIIMDYYTYLI